LVSVSGTSVATPFNPYMFGGPGTLPGPVIAAVNCADVQGVSAPTISTDPDAPSFPLVMSTFGLSSLTDATTWLLRWPGQPGLLAPFKAMQKSLRWGPEFPRVRPETDLVLIGDGLREWVACEVALKLQEAAYVRARSFGLEEFLHGPRVSVGEGSLVVGFSSRKEKRWDAARRYLKTVEVPFVEAASEDWLAQVLWGQRFTIDCCRRLGIDPDLLRSDDPRYRRALAET